MLLNVVCALVLVKLSHHEPQSTTTTTNVTILGLGNFKSYIYGSDTLSYKEDLLWQGRYLDFGRLEVMAMKKANSAIHCLPIQRCKDVVCLFDLGFGLFGCLVCLNGGKQHNPPQGINC